MTAVRSVTMPPAGGGRPVWVGAALTVGAVHAGALALAVLWRPPADFAAPPAAATMVDLAPMTAPPAPATDKAPEIEQTEAKPVERPETKPRPPPPKRRADLALPETRPRPPAKADPRPARDDRPQEHDTAPAAAAAPPAPAMTAPAPGVVAPSSDALPTWQGALRAHLEQHKRYPAFAQLRRQQGMALVRFSMGHDGTVHWSRLERGSGHDRLDDEALALLQRAQPLPPPPPDIPGDPIELVVPIQFFLK